MAVTGQFCEETGTNQTKQKKQSAGRGDRWKSIHLSPLHTDQDSSNTFTQTAQQSLHDMTADWHKLWKKTDETFPNTMKEIFQLHHLLSTITLQHRSSMKMTTVLFFYIVLMNKLKLLIFAIYQLYETVVVKNV